MQISHLLPMHLFDSLLDQEEEDSQCEIEPNQLSTCLFSFFDLYGNNFEMSENVISVNAGEWLKYQLGTNNASVPLPQKR